MDFGHRGRARRGRGEVTESREMQPAGETRLYWKGLAEPHCFPSLTCAWVITLPQPVIGYGAPNPLEALRGTFNPSETHLIVPTI